MHDRATHAPRRPNRSLHAGRHVVWGAATPAPLEHAGLGERAGMRVRPEDADGMHGGSGECVWAERRAILTELWPQYERVEC